MLKGGRKGSSGGEEGEEKKKSFAWLQSKQAEEDSMFFSLTPGSGSDRRVVYVNECVRLLVFARLCMLSRDSSVSISWGRRRTWEKALVARKKQSAVLKQYQL